MDEQPFEIGRPATITTPLVRIEMTVPVSMGGEWSGSETEVAELMDHVLPAAGIAAGILDRLLTNPSLAPFARDVLRTAAAMLAEDHERLDKEDDL